MLSFKGKQGVIECPCDEGVAGMEGRGLGSVHRRYYYTAIQGRRPVYIRYYLNMRAKPISFA